jgi:hypothetical protein
MQQLYPLNTIIISVYCPDLSCRRRRHLHQRVAYCFPGVQMPRYRNRHDRSGRQVLYRGRVQVEVLYPKKAPQRLAILTPGRQLLNRETLLQDCNKQVIPNVQVFYTTACNFLQIICRCIQRHGIFGSGKLAAPLRQVIFSKCSSAASNGMEFLARESLLQGCGRQIYPNIGVLRPAGLPYLRRFGLS